MDAGTHREERDTTSTATDSGYAEASFTLDIAHRARTLPEELGARVEFTHDGDRPYGPCVDERARIGNEAGADTVVSVHAAGSGEGDRGFHLVLPARVTEGAADTRRITAPSRRLGGRDGVRGGARTAGRAGGTGRGRAGEPAGLRGASFRTMGPAPV
ncbi:N-acetylmuramoyl-L-alanine amidase [Streptomyces sp. CNQ085]|uniref:N-acetylmuramoyl-L-alanine amidase n=1 Tax=Streptomyces sp. CNQ085 TaxID=2886944 RepID=UPI0035B053EF